MLRNTARFSRAIRYILSILQPYPAVLRQVWKAANGNPADVVKSE